MSLPLMSKGLFCFLLVAFWSPGFAFSSFHSSISRSTTKPSLKQHHRNVFPFLSRLQQSSPDDADIIEDGGTLLSMHLTPSLGVTMEDALLAVQKYAQKFPYCSVLPVQPLTYKTTKEGGVQLKFLRKKTQEKSSVDGGVNFYIQLVAAQDDAEEFEDDIDDIDDDDDDDDDTSSNINDKPLIQVTAKRNSFGQSVAKIFAEKLLITRFVGGLKGEKETLKLLPAHIQESIMEQVQVTSLYHKWMDIKLKEQ